jgi:hypothetical protein
MDEIKGMLFEMGMNKVDTPLPNKKVHSTLGSKFN